MAFRRFANARVTHPRISARGWGRVRTAAKKQGGPSPVAAENLATRASEILGQPFSPEQYLLSHATIVASVDTDEVPDIKLGQVKLASGKTIDRRWGGYYVKPECSDLINNNGDGWSRDVLLASYPTFIGGHNFQEHIQIEELSKGRIIDAAARDIGHSVYVDILVATDRRHTQLVKDIESGKMGTLSMGCFLPGTMVSLADGTRIPIEEVQPGEMVLTHKGNAKPVANQQIRGGDWKLRRIRAVGVNDELVATDFHPFFVFRAHETCACECGEELPAYSESHGPQTTRAMTRRFKVGHDKRVFNPKNTYDLDEHRKRQSRMAEIKSMQMEEVRAADLKVGDFLCFPRAQFVELPGDGITTGKARLLGYFLAEGSFLKHNGKPCEVQFSFSMEEKDTFVSEVVELLQQEFPQANTPWVQDREDRTTCVVHVTGQEMVQWFLQHGGEYSHRKRLSAEAMTWPAEMHKHLVGTWLNGDGWFTDRLAGSTASYDLACQLHLLMSRVGLFTRMHAHIQGQAVEIRQVVNGGVVIKDEATGRFPTFGLHVGATDAVKLSGYCDKAPSSSTHKSRELRVLDDVVMFPITSIEDDTYTGWVYDLEVEDDHSYVVEGVAVHNCTTETTQCTKCGNVAVDDTDTCECIRYHKLDTFYDASGQRRVIAELCGHPSLGDTAGVVFIEASWVAQPAFTGAVLRNVLTAPQAAKRSQTLQDVLGRPPTAWEDTSTRKVASVAFEFGDPSEEEEAGPPEPPAPGPLDETKDKLKQKLIKDVRKDIEEDMDNTSPSDEPVVTDNTLQAYSRAASVLTRTATSDTDLINRLALLDAEYDRKAPRELYLAALHAGGKSFSENPTRYMLACQDHLGTRLGLPQVKVLRRLGSYLSLLESHPHKISTGV